MATFHIPGDVVSSVTAFGAGAPPSGYYSATIENVQKHPTRATSRRMNLKFEGGFTTLEWLNSPYDENGNKAPNLSDKQVRGMVAAIKTVFISAGYTNDDMANGITDDWLNDRTVYLEWHAAKDLGAQYGRIAKFINKEVFDAKRAADEKPAIAAASNGSTGRASVPPVVTKAPPLPTAAAAPAPTSGPGLPPPPSAAQSMTR